MEKGRSSKRSKAVRAILYVLGVMYLSTWIWGIPTAHTAITKRVIGNYKLVLARHPNDVFPTHPRLRFGASYAIFPFVTVNHYEYNVAALWGWGGFTVDVWYFTGTKPILGITKWIS